MRRFKKAVEKSDILKILREYEAYEKPSERKKRLKAAAVKRWKRKEFEMSLPAHKLAELQQKEEKKKQRR
jgi:small subunit ribosomal protein S21